MLFRSAFTAEGDPNSGIIVGDDGVIVIDAQATPVMAGLVIERVRKITDKPIKYVVLSHYHAVRVLGASAYKAQEVIGSEKCRAMIAERGKENGIKDVVFDRGGYLYHGRIKALADAAREGGLKF